MNSLKRLLKLILVTFVTPMPFFVTRTAQFRFQEGLIGKIGSLFRKIAGKIGSFDSYRDSVEGIGESNVVESKRVDSCESQRDDSCHRA